MKHEKKLNLQSICLIILTLIAVCGILKTMRSQLVPVAMAVLFSFIFQPFVKFLHEKVRLPQFLAIFIVVVLFVTACYMIVNMLWNSLKMIQSQYQKYEEKASVVYKSLADIFRLPYDENLSLPRNLWSQNAVRSFFTESLAALSNSILNFGTSFIAMLIFMIFFIGEINLIPLRAQRIFVGSLPEKFQTMLFDVAGKVTHYISIKFAISFLTGFFVAAGCLAVKLDFAVFWGFLAFILNFIPNIGSIASGVFTTGFAVVQFWGNFRAILAIGLLMLLVNMILGNIVEPRLQGDQLGISTFGILISLSVWGFLWGFVGLVLAVPLMAIIKIVADNVDELHWLSLLLANKKTLLEGR